MDINAYDAMNRVAAITNALGDATIYEYDHRGNKTYEGGATYPVRYTYDVYGNKTTMTTYRHEPDGGDVGHAANGRHDGNPDACRVGRRLFSSLSSKRFSCARSFAAVLVSFILDSRKA